MAAGNIKKVIKTITLLKTYSVSKSDKIAAEMRACQSQIEKIERTIRDLTQQSEDEESLSAALQESVLSLSLIEFRKSQEDKQQALADDLRDQQQQYDLLRQQLNILFGDQKAYDVTKDNITEAFRKAQQKQEQDFIDDLTGMRWKGAEST